MPASGAVQLRALALRFKAAGMGELRLELMRGIKSAAAPLVVDVRQAAREQLPKEGGLNVRVASSPIKVSVRTGANTAGVRIVTTEHDTRGTDRGTFRHPVFGHRDRFVSQRLDTSGWFSGTLRQKAPEVAPHVVEAMNVVALKVTRGGL